MCSVCGTKFGPQKQQHQQPRQEKQRPQQKQAVGLKRTLSAEEEKSNVLFHMGFDDRIVRQALEKVSGGGDNNNKHSHTTIGFSNNHKNCEMWNNYDAGSWQPCSCSRHNVIRRTSRRRGTAAATGATIPAATADNANFASSTRRDGSPAAKSFVACCADGWGWFNSVTRPNKRPKSAAAFYIYAS